MAPQTRSKVKAAKKSPQQALADICTHVQLILNRIESLPPFEDLGEAFSELAEPVQDLCAELCKVRALEPRAEYIPKVLVSLDAHLSHPIGPLPNFAAIANGDTSIAPQHPWLKKIPVEADGSMDCKAEHPPESGRSTTAEPQEKKRQLRKNPHRSCREGSGVVTPAVKGELDPSTTPTSVNKGKARARSPFSPESTHQPSMGVEHTRAGAGSAEAEIASENRLLHQPESSTAPGPSTGEPQPRLLMRRTSEASRPTSHHPGLRTNDQPPASLPSLSSGQVSVCGSCGKRSIEDRITSLEGVMLQLLYVIKDYKGF